MNEAHRFRSPLLGEASRVDLTGGQLEVFVRGEGPTVVFTHGWLSNANLWRNVVDRLANHHRCVVLDLPFGAHRVPFGEYAPLDAQGCAELITEAIERLALVDVTLVGNDSGGAYSQIALAAHPERVARLVLTSCETPFDQFPPKPFDALPTIAQDPQQLGELLGALEDPAVRKLDGAFGLLVKHPLDSAVSDSYALPCVREPDVIRDVAKVMAGAATEAVHRAGRTLIERWDKPTLFVWSLEDPVFPIEHARRYAGELADASIVDVHDCYSFTPEDQPAQVADAILAFAS